MGIYNYFQIIKILIYCYYLNVKLKDHECRSEWWGKTARKKAYLGNEFYYPQFSE